MPLEPDDSARRLGARSHQLTAFVFAGAELTALPGQTVAAALLAHGIRSWRTTRVAGRPRGLFCGIGVCFDCLVTVDGRPNVRACLEPVRAGALVEPQKGTGHDAFA
jgi:predicted molibdopterin-dependent oxidoreductase YjgC